MNGCAVCSAVSRSAATSRRAESRSHERDEAPARARPSPRRGSRCRPAPRRGPCASVSIARISSSELVAARPVGAHQRRWRGRRGRPAAGPSRPRSSRTIAARSCSPWKSSARASPPSSPTRSSELLVAERGRRLLEQLDRALVGDARAPARVLVADRGAREQPPRPPARGRSPAAGAERRRARRAPCRRGGSRCRARAAASARSGGPARSPARARCAAAPPPRRTRARRWPPARRARCTRRRARRPRTARRRRSGARGRRGRGRSAPPARSSASPTRRWSSARRSAGEPVVERPAHELVGEAVGQPRARAAPRSSRCAPPRRARRAARAPPSPAARRTMSSSNSAPAAAASSSRSVVRGARRESRWLTTSRTLSGVPSSVSGRVSRIAPSAISTTPGLDQRAPQLADQERVALGEVADRPGELGRARRRAAAARPDELGHLVAGEARRAAAARRRRSGAGRRASPRAPPARRPRCRGTWRAAAGARARPPARGGAGAERRRVGPVPVLEHEQHRPRRPTPQSRSVTAVCRRWRSVSGSASTGAGSSPTRAGRSGSSRVSSPPAVPSAARSSAGSSDPREVVERLDERPVGRAHHRVAGAVEHERAVAGRLERRTRAPGGSCPSRARRRAARPAGPRPPPAASAPGASPARPSARRTGTST